MSGFDKDLGKLGDELDVRSAEVRDKGVSWNYNKYAYIRVRSTGESKTVILAEDSLSLGDGFNLGAPIDLYSKEGNSEIRKFKPTLNDVKITNQGGQDYTDSYIYEVEFSFTVYTLNDLNRAEASFFRVGTELEFEFGWRGRKGIKGNSGTVKANATAAESQSNHTNHRVVMRHIEWNFGDRCEIGLVEKAVSGGLKNF